MKTPSLLNRRNAAAPRSRGVIGAIAVISLGVAWAPAQTRIVQDGRLFDANPQVGGARYNYQYGRPVSPLLGGNAVATGNIGRGFAFEGFSPISAPTSFRASLGSGALSGFTRDSISVADSYSPGGGLTPRFYFDPSRTAPTAGFLKGYYSPPAPATYSAPPSASAGTSSGSAVANPWGGLQYGSPPTLPARGFVLPKNAAQYGASNQINPELSSTIFGVQPIRLPDPLTSQAVPEQSSYALPGKGPENGDAAAGGPMDMRLWVNRELNLPDSGKDVFSQAAAASILSDDADDFRFAQTLTPGMDVPSPPDVAAGSPPVDARVRDFSMTPGHDVFTDMRLALGLLDEPDADWYDEMREVAANDPTQAPKLEATAPQAANDFITRMLEAPLQSFANQGDAPVNAALRKAEAAMESGRFRDAMRDYERASQLDAINPLPLIGKGHAALAAGEYMTAAASLAAGLERFPDIAQFPMNLEMLIGGGEVVDIRRADLMKLLQQREDANLRFLLGYLEYHTGMTELGLRDLDKAAQSAAPGSLIRRYPDMLRRTPRKAAPAKENE